MFLWALKTYGCMKQKQIYVETTVYKILERKQGGGDGGRACYVHCINSLISAGGPGEHHRGECCHGNSRRRHLGEKRDETRGKLMHLL